MKISKKIGITASLATILGFIFTLFSGQASSTNQTINGNENTVIQENNGTINIDNGDKILGKEKSFVLKNDSAGVSLVLSEPSLVNMTDTRTHVCNAVSGTPIEMTGNTQGSMWREVRITAGECAGKKGWASTSVISFE